MMYDKVILNPYNILCMSEHRTGNKTLSTIKTTRKKY